MLAVYGVLLLASAYLVFVWAYGQFRRAAPKKWTTWETTSNAVVLSIIALFAFGVGALIKAAIGFVSSPITVTQAAMIAAVLALSFVADRVLRRQAAPYMTAPAAEFAISEAGMGTLTGAANDTGPGRGRRPGKGVGTDVPRRG